MNFRAPLSMLILGMIKVVKLSCCYTKTHIWLCGISAFDILA